MDQQNSRENIPCKWSECFSSFNSELDMGLHVIANHLNVLDYGHFVLNRHFSQENAQNQILMENEPSSSAQTFLVDSLRNDPVTEENRNPENPQNEEPVEEPPEAPKPVVPVVKRVIAPEPIRKEPKQETVEEPVEEDPNLSVMVQPAVRKITTSDLIENSTIIRQWIKQVKSLSPDHKFLESSTYCIMCLHQYPENRPCRSLHTLAAIRVKDDWMRKYSSRGSVDRKTFISQLSEMHNDYEEQTMKLDESQEGPSNSGPKRQRLQDRWCIQRWPAFSNGKKPAPF